MAAIAGNTPNRYRFNGQQLDGASGLYYLRARYYDQGLGRFLSHDPVLGDSEDPITLHCYLYAANDAVNFADPSGKMSIGMQVTVMSVMTVVSGVALGGVYQKRLGGSFVEGFIAGARLGLSFTAAVLYSPEILPKAVGVGVLNGLGAVWAFDTSNIRQGGRSQLSNPAYAQRLWREFIKGFTSGFEGVVYGQVLGDILKIDENEDEFIGITVGLSSGILTFAQDFAGGERNWGKLIGNAMTQGLVSGVAAYLTVKSGESVEAESVRVMWDWMLAPLIGSGFGVFLPDLLAGDSQPEFP